MLQLTIVTPERKFLEATCANVTVPGKLGEMQVLPGHAAVLAEIVSGVMSFENDKRENFNFMVGEGVVEIDHDHVNVLCEQARYKTEVDKDLEEKLLAELRDKIKNVEQDDLEERRLAAELSRCMARLSLFE